MKPLACLFFIVFSFTSIITYGQVKVDTSDNSKLKISALVDIYYAYDFNKPLNKDRQYTTQAARHNEFNLNWGLIQADYHTNKVRATLALHTGTYVQFNYAAEPNGLSKLIAQANAGIRLFRKAWLDVGILPSHIGYESTFSGDNEIYTRALMAENSPYFSTGVQLSVALSDKMNIKLVLLNGWQNITETNDSKSVGINLNYMPTEKLELNYSNYIGNEGDKVTGRKMRFFNHMYALYQFTQKFHTVIAFDYGSQELWGSNKNGIWHTGMAVAAYNIGEKTEISARVEYYHDKDQIIINTGINQGFQVYGASFNFNYRPVNNVVLRMEGRVYNSRYKIFNAGETAENHNTLLVSSLAISF